MGEGLESSGKDRLQSRALLVLLLSVGLTMLLYWVPALQTVSLPLLYLSTMVHELGHGFGAILVGGDFIEFRMYPDGSGVAPVAGIRSQLGAAVVMAGGLVGPAIAAGIGLAFGRHPSSARLFLGAVGAVLVLALVLWTRNQFGFVFVGAVAAVCLLAAVQPRAELAQLFLVFLCVQLALSVYSRGGYLFTEVARTGEGEMPSDVAQMAAALGGPYWLWGGICAAVSVVALVAGAWAMLGRGRRRGA